MAGSLTAQPGSSDMGTAAYQVTGTGGALDSHRVTASVLLDPNGQPLGQCWNGVSWDQLYNNVQGVLAPAAARTAAPAIATQTNPNHRGIMLFLNITASPASATSTLILALNALEPVTGTALYAISTPTALSATAVANAVAGLYVVQVYPGLPAVAAMTRNGAAASANGIIPRVWNASVTPNDAQSWSYSLAYALAV